MRNLFDQYKSPENRLTHALASCLAEDPPLLRQFIRWTTGRRVPASAALEVLEQQLPGEEGGISAGEVERRGIPDMCIHDGEHWCLAVENKVMSPVVADQLERHRRTVQRRGVAHVDLLVLTAGGRPVASRDGLCCRQWTEVYRWAMERRERPWAARLREYLEVAEIRMTEDRYLTEGSLTEFSGVPFGPGQPYNYLEAKRALTLLVKELRGRTQLAKELHAGLTVPGRPAITGEGGHGVWDFLRLDGTAEGGFTKAPHLTVSVRQDEVWVMLCLSNAMAGIYRSRMKQLGVGGFVDLLGHVARRDEQLLQDAVGYQPRVEVLQRRYPSQRSEAIVDGRIEADLRTLLVPEARTSNRAIHTQPLWARAAYDVLTQRRGNVQLGIGVAFPFARCPVVRLAKLVDCVSAAWVACRPAIDLLFGRVTWPAPSCVPGGDPPPPSGAGAGALLAISSARSAVKAHPVRDARLPPHVGQHGAATDDTGSAYLRSTPQVGELRPRANRLGKASRSSLV